MGKLCTGMFLVFLVLKLTSVIGWSWWWVTSPLWIGAMIWLAVVVAATFIMTTFFK